MDMDFANTSYACSTLIIGSFSFTEESTIQTFKSQLLRIIEVEFGDYGDLSGDGHSFDDFAFVVASTNSDSQPVAERLLEEIGFHGQPTTHNSKNNSNVRFWSIPVPVLLAKMAEIG